MVNSPAMLIPRGLTRQQAAAYCGVSPAAFDRWVAVGIMPGRAPGTHRWDRHALDHAWDRLSGLERKGSDEDAAAVALDAWLAEHTAHNP